MLQRTRFSLWLNITIFNKTCFVPKLGKKTKFHILGNPMATISHYHFDIPYWSLGTIIRKLNHEKTTWKTKRFSFCACMTCYEYLRQRQKYSTHLCLSRKNENLFSSMLFLHNSIFRWFPLVNVGTCLYDRDQYCRNP